MVASEVRIVRGKTELIEKSIKSASFMVLYLRKYSRIRSKTTTVSYRENPRIVRNAITVAGVTSYPVAAYTPMVITMS